MYQNTNRKVCSKHIFCRKYDGHPDIQDKYRDTSSNNVSSCLAIAVYRPGHDDTPQECNLHPTIASPHTSHNTATTVELATKFRKSCILSH